jgi:uncharacterized protein YggE
MFMRNVAYLLLLSLTLASCAKEADPRGVERDEVLLQVMASGRTDSRPDTARFTAGVETIAASAAAASSGNNEKMNRVVAGLERLGIKADDLQTRQISMQRIDYGPNRGQFQASNMIEVRVRQIARAGDAIAAATEAGANVLSGPNMTVSDPEAASRSAYAQAFKAARARAEAYAEAAGLKVSRVLAIRDGGESGAIPYHSMDANMSAQVSAPPPVSAPPMRPGMNASEVRVRADFALSPK